MDIVQLNALVERRANHEAIQINILRLRVNHAARRRIQGNNHSGLCITQVIVDIAQIYGIGSAFVVALHLVDLNNSREICIGPCVRGAELHVSIHIGIVKAFAGGVIDAPAA